MPLQTHPAASATASAAARAGQRGRRDQRARRPQHHAGGEISRDVIHLADQRRSMPETRSSRRSPLMSAAHGLGAWFDRSDRPYLADISATVGSIVFGRIDRAVGQMYHISEISPPHDAVVGGAALVAAALTGFARCACGGARRRVCLERHAGHRSGRRAAPAVRRFWLAGGALAAFWKTVRWRATWVRRRGAGLAVTIFHRARIDRYHVNPNVADCRQRRAVARLQSAVAHFRSEPLRALAVTLSTYASFALAIVLAPVGF